MRNILVRGIGLSCMSLLALAGCGTSGAEVVSGDPNAVLQQDRAIRVLDDADFAALQPPAADGRLVFESGAPALTGLQANDVLVADVSDVTPAGLLRRVVSIEGHGSQTVLVTEPAVLEDVFYSAQLTQELQVGAEDVVQLESHLEGVEIGQRASPLKGSLDFKSQPIDVDLLNVVVADADGDHATKGDQLRVSGRITVVPTFKVALDIGAGSVKSFRFVNADVLRTEVKLDGDLALADFQKTISLAALKLAPVTFALGPVPVVIVPAATLKLNVQGRLGGKLTSSVTAETNVEVGFQYEKGAWSLVHALPRELKDINVGYTLPTLNGSATASAAAEARASLMFYGVAGPFASVSGTSRIDAGGSTAGSSWVLNAGVRADAGVEATLFKQKLSYSTPLFAKEWKVADGQL